MKNLHFSNKYDLNFCYVPKSPLEIRLNDEPRHKNTFSFNLSQNKKLHDDLNFIHKRQIEEPLIKEPDLNFIHKRQIEEPLIIEPKPTNKKVTIGSLLSPNNPYLDDSDLEYSDDEDNKERKIAELFKKNDVSQSISSLLSDSVIEPFQNNEEKNKFEVGDLKKQVERIREEEKRKEIIKQQEKDNSFASPSKNIFTQKENKSNTNFKPSDGMTYQFTSPLRDKLEVSKKGIFSTNIKFSSENKPSILPSQKLQERINYTSFKYEKDYLDQSNNFKKSSIERKRSIFPSSEATQENKIKVLTHDFKSFIEHNANIEQKNNIKKTEHQINGPINFSRSINLSENYMNLEKSINLKECNNNIKNCERINKQEEYRNISFADRKSLFHKI